MSLQIIAAVWENGPEEIYQKMVLMALADHCNENDEAWPSVARIAKLALCSERKVQSTLRQLETLGWIIGEARTAEYGRTTSKKYRIIRSAVGLPEKRKKAENPTPAKTAPEVHSVRGGGAQRAGERVHSVHPREGAQRAPLEVTIRKNARTRARARPAEIAWAVRELNDPATPNQEKDQIRAWLHKMNPGGAEQCEAIES